MLERFTDQYAVTKTLRFELIPMGKTRENIERHGIIKSDEALAESYERMKKPLDEYHKSFMDEALTGVELTGLEEYYALYKAGENTDAQKKALRKTIADCFKKHPKFKNLNKKELVKKDLKAWIGERRPELQKDYDVRFENFFTYLSGYNQARMNMYVAEDKATSVAHRLIDENLPKFIDNMGSFAKIKAALDPEKLEQLRTEIAQPLGFEALEELFTLQAYSGFLTQKRIDAYNAVLGGRTTEEGEKLQGLNEYINLHNQTHPEKKLPLLKPLFKQILSDRAALSWLPKEFADEEELLENVRAFHADFTAEDGIGDRLLRSMDALAFADPQGVYLAESSLSGISNRLFGDYSVLRSALKIDDDAEEGKKEKYRSLAEVQTALDAYAKTTDADLPAYSPDCICDSFQSVRELAEAAETAYGEAEAFFSAELIMSGNGKEKLKAYLDGVLTLLHFVRPLYPRSGAGLKKDETFYGAFSPVCEQLMSFTKLYDMVRNFATKKPYKTEKLKLTFDTKNGNLLSGWTDSKTDQSDNGTQYGGYLFRKKNGIGQYDYYLGISRNKKLFRSFNPVPTEKQSEYERLDYYQAKGQTIYGSSYQGKSSYGEDKAALMQAITDFAARCGNTALHEAVATYANGEQSTPSGCMKLFSDSSEEYQKLLRDDNFREWNQIIIENLQKTMRAMTRLPHASEIAVREYTLFTEIMSDIESISKAKVYQYFFVNQDELDAAMRDEKSPLYLFKISNKDLSYAEKASQGLRKSHGKDNLHTMYFKALMSGEQSIYDLGSGEVFFRKPSIDNRNNTVHEAGKPIENKNPERKKKTSTFAYDITKDRRYTVDKFQFHLSISCNCLSDKSPKKFNDSVFAYLQNNPDVNVIGIDRGERHLLYLSMIDRNGHVVRDKNGKYIQYSLNTITGEYKSRDGQSVQFKTPYHKLLDEKEAKRREARQSWDTIENIKELKSGYLSQVVHHIAQLMVEYNAIVVLEDLNGGFKNGRKRVEKQVYQNFEKALIEKLNYLVLKDRDPEEPGGLYHALQLTDKFESFQKLNKQTGFLFYVPAWNTSSIDPVTGFVDLLKPKYSSMPDSRAFFGKFDAIRYNPEKDWFEFAFDYSNFTDKAKETRLKWTVCTVGKERYTYNPKTKRSETVNVTAELKRLFEQYGVDYRGGDDLRAAITAQSEKDFFYRLTKLLKLTLALRYSSREADRDFILSPVADKNGEFFCSEAGREGWPRDADANGAFNIARKGLWVLEQIDKAEKPGKFTTKISNREWLAYVQKRS